MVARGRGRAQSVSYQFFSLAAVIVIICFNSKIIHMARQASSVEHGQHDGSCAVFSVAVLGIRSKLRISFLRDEQAFASFIWAQNFINSISFLDLLVPQDIDRIMLLHGARIMDSVKPILDSETRTEDVKEQVQEREITRSPFLNLAVSFIISLVFVNTWPGAIL